MASRNLGRWFLITICILCVCYVSSGSVLPTYSVWPLTNKTRYFEVTDNEERGYLFGDQFVDGPFSSQPSSGAFELNGTTHVDLEILSEFDSLFTVSVYFYLNTKEGDLLQYIDPNEETVFRVWAHNSGISAEVHTSSSINLLEGGNDLSPNAWILLAFSRDASTGKIELGVNGDSQGSTDKDGGGSFENDFVLQSNGMLRLGSDGIRGRVACVVISNLFDVQGTIDVAQEQCTNNALWKYKEINECESMPCQNNQPCKDRFNGFLCECGADFTGPLCETELNRDWDEGYYRLDKTEYGPSETLSALSVTTLNRRRCGQNCVEYPGCLSFTVTKMEKKHYNCVLYTQVYTADVFASNLRYYVSKLIKVS